LIDWEKPIFLCEGVFDSFFLTNSIPLLGKHLPELLFGMLYDNAKNDIIICLDGDAFENAKKEQEEVKKEINDIKFELAEKSLLQASKPSSQSNI
jgi:hypothetical protein